MRVKAVRQMMLGGGRASSPAPGRLVIAEHNLVGAAGTGRCADQLVLADNVAGIVDGATRKPWDDLDGPDGRTLADAVSAYLAELGSAVDLREVLDESTALVANLLDRHGIEPGGGSAAAFTIVHLGARQIWRVGEAHVMVDGSLVPEKATAELVVARARALVLHELLLSGATVADLRRDDVGRRAVEPILRALVGVRNRKVAGYPNVAVDGRTVSSDQAELIVLPAETCEVVITSDGYPEAAPSLAAAESLLRRRLESDPLLIAEPPATKGWTSGNVSFDDRAYVRVILPPA